MQALPDLLEELSHGLRFDELPAAREYVLAPSYWGAPILFAGYAGSQRRIYLFGARPPEMSLVPGQVVPDGLMRSLKALSDSTRLRILHYLAEEPLTPSQLARRLRLRPPTVIHHLRTLRLAGLVQVTVGEDEETKCYAVRAEAVDAACAALRGFVVKGEPPAQT
jgi:DNA-binding transcriptional ArsR family regulator